MNKVKWGIIGTGRIASLFTKDIRLIDNSEVIAVCSRKHENGKIFADKYDIPLVYTDYSEMLANGEIDCIYIATPHIFHKENSIKALQSNKAVLCEKPMSLSYKDAKEIISLAKKKKVLFMEALWSRFLPAVQKLLELLNNGIIGDIRFIKADFGMDIGIDYPENGRLLNSELGGGALFDIGIYPIAFAQFISKKIPVKVESTKVLSKTNVDLISTYTFEYLNGTVAVLFASMLSETESNLFIKGTKGFVNMANFWKGNKFTVHFKNGRVENHSYPKLGDGYTHEIKSFIDTFLEGKYENKIMPHSESLVISKILDTIYNQIKN